MRKIKIAKATLVVYLTITAIFFLNQKTNAQAPNISYPSGAKVYNVGTTITPLTPTNSGGAINYANVVSTFAGSGTAGAIDATGIAASFNSPSGVAIDAAGNVYVADQLNHKIRRITSAGVVSTFAGSGSQGAVDATGTAASFNYPSGVAVDAAGNVYVADNQNHKIRKITAAGVVSTFAGSGSQGSLDATGTAASFRFPSGLAVDAAGNVYVADLQNHKIRKITAAGVVSTFAGSGSQGAVDATGTAARFSNPTGVALDAAGNVYVADQSNHKIRKITAAGVVSTFAGSGTVGAIDATGTAARFNNPSGVTVGAGGDIYVADQSNHKIRKITVTGVVSTFAGSGSQGAVDATGTAASFKVPSGIAIDAARNIYVADQWNNKIRKINTLGYSISPSLPASLTIDEQTGVISGTPTVATSATNYTITATNQVGNSSTVVNIATQLSNNANLSALLMSSGTLTPVFAQATTSYNASVANNVASITVTPTAEDIFASSVQIKINNGVYSNVVSGFASLALPLNLGNNTLNVKVIAQDGVTTKVYTITVRRLSNDVTLSNLSVSSGTLSPSFSSAITNYRDTVLHMIDSLTVTATSNSNLATIRVRVNSGVYTPIISGTASNKLGLNFGDNIINIEVTAEDGTTIKNYNITVRRVSNNAFLNGLVVSSGIVTPPFSLGVTNYNVTVANSVTSISSQAYLSDGLASLKYQYSATGPLLFNIASGATTPNLSLTVGNNILTFLVTAEDGITTKTYTVTIRRVSNDATLSNLVLSAGTLNPIFTSSIINYNATVANTNSSITVTPTTTNPFATVQVQVNGGSYTTVASGTASTALALNNGNNTVNIRVIADDGINAKIYTVTVKRISNNADLSNLFTSQGTLTPFFNATTTTYTTTVTNPALNIQTNATVADANATLQYQFNGGSFASFSSGTYTPNLLLNVGNNIVNILVRAEDGSTTKTYTITVTRLPSSNAYLTGLSLSTGGITPTFALSTYTYSSTSVANNITATSITAMVQEPNATIQARVNSSAYINLVSGTASVPLTLAVGANTLEIKVTAQDGTTVKVYTITLNRLPLPPVISYNSPQNFIVGTAITSITPNNTGGAATSYTIVPVLPTGLIFNTTTGVISGTPTINSNTTTYTVTAFNTGGNNLTTIDIETVYPLPIITSVSKDTVCTGNSLTITGFNFYGISSVKIGGVPQSSFVVNSTTSITINNIKAKTGVISLINANETGFSSNNIYVGGVPSFQVLPANFKLCGGASREVNTTLAIPATYTLSNGQVGNPVSVAATGNYNITATDIYKCFSTSNFSVTNFSPCGGYLEVISDTAINYFGDTIHVKVRIRNGVDIFSTFAFLNFNDTYLTLLDSKNGDYLGNSIIIQPPVITGNKIDFGMTKTIGQPGSNGDGIIYEFRFIIKALPPTVTFDQWFPKYLSLPFSLTNLSIYNVGGVQPASFSSISLLSDTTRLLYYVPVWPGDLNNDKKVRVDDLLPVGYCYGATGPIRPEGNFAWKAQPGIMWGYDLTTKSSSAYHLFVDGNADGMISLADQASIGFNISKSHARMSNANAIIKQIPPTVAKGFPTNLPAVNVNMPDTLLQSTALPLTEKVSITMGSASYPLNNLYGVAFEIYFDPAYVNTTNISTDYLSSIFGTLNVNYTKIEDFSEAATGKISIALTRFNTTVITANGGQIMNINFPLIATAPTGWFKVTAIPIGCNDKLGNNIVVTGSVDSLRINGVNLSISGRLKTPLLKPIKTATCNLKGISTTASDAAGGYQFTSGITANSNVVIKPTKNNDISKANGVTSTDVLLVQRHILGTTKLNSAYKIIAADVDGNKAINSVDILRMKRLILGTDTTFTSTTKGNRLWDFVDSAYVFPDTTNPFPFKDSISFTNLTSNKTNQTFIGVKLGDVNYDWNAAVARQSTVGSRPSTDVELVYHVSSTNEKSNPTDFFGKNLRNGEIRIPVTVNNFRDITAMQYTLHFDNKTYEFVGIENNNLNIDFNDKEANTTGNISMLWTDRNAEPKTLEDGTELFVLVLRLTVNSTLSTDLTLTNEITETEAWDKDFNQHNIILSKRTTINEQQETRNEWFSVSPNPTSEEIKIDIASKVNKVVSFELTDAQGKTVIKQAVELQKGNNNFTMNLKKNGNITSGIYFLKAIGIEGENVKKVMVK